MTVQLDAEQIDALSEIFNIGVGKAAAAMGALMRDEVLLSVPHVSIFTVSEAAQQLGAAGSTMYGVRQPFRGALNGDALLIFPGHKSLELVRTQAGSRAGSLLDSIDRTVTGAGARLLAHVNAQEAQSHGLVQQLQDLATQQAQQVRVACTEGFAVGFLPRVMSALSSRAVSIRTGVKSLVLRKRSTNSNPSINGILISITKRSGL